LFNNNYVVFFECIIDYSKAFKRMQEKILLFSTEY
jgi:hypothetical protein